LPLLPDFLPESITRSGNFVFKFQIFVRFPPPLLPSARSSSAVCFLIFAQLLRRSKTIRAAQADFARFVISAKMIVKRFVKI
jgi:hypothetical protein